MKFGILGIAIFVCFAAFSHAQNYTIKGTVESSAANGRTIYLQQFDENYKKRVNIDSTTVVDNQFLFTGVAPDVATFASVVVDQPNKKAFPLQSMVILEPGDISIELGEINALKGTERNVGFDSFLKTLKAIEESDSDENSLYTKTYSDYAKLNSGTPIGDYILITSSYLYPIDELRELLSGTTAKFKETQSYTALADYCAALEATSVGSQYVNVSGKTPGGKAVSLSDYVGKNDSKYVLIDFWASWCGPCRKEMPSIVKAYAEYAPKGLEIVGISLDTDNASWVNAIEQLNITWPQMSDLKGWKSELSKPYAVSSIPNTVIVDKDGKIVARGLYGEGLLNKLEELFK